MQSSQGATARHFEALNAAGNPPLPRLQSRGLVHLVAMVAFMLDTARLVWLEHRLTPGTQVRGSPVGSCTECRVVPFNGQACVRRCSHHRLPVVPSSLHGGCDVSITN